jgi:hypothetical protein
MDQASPLREEDCARTGFDTASERMLVTTATGYRKRGDMSEREGEWE